ncbi:response regulator [Pseudaestuariivita sp.]|uniref:response regulator n=1 Tax=Pseudaestuariivita sp. TaxID=2211669 RepID=UPI00405A42C6
MSRTTAVIADDHMMIRQGLREILTSAGLDVVGEAADGLEAVAQVRKHRPALLTLDIAMPYARGIEIFGEVRRWSPETRVIVFSGMTSTGLLADLDAAGADGIFLKSGALEDFSDAIPRVLAGETVRSQAVEQLVAEAQERKVLTLRERQVLSLIAQGHGNREIADRLGVSPKTVDNHRTNLMRKLDAHSMAELLAYALREGLLDANREA